MSTLHRPSTIPPNSLHNYGLAPDPNSGPVLHDERVQADAMWPSSTKMPLYPTSSASRPRKTKEERKERERESRDSRPHTHTHTSKSESRSRRRHHKSDDERYSPPPTSPALYSQHNIALDKVPLKKTDIPPPSRGPLPSAAKARPKSIALPLSDVPKNLQKYQPTVEDYQSENDLSRFISNSPRSSTRSVVSTSDRERQYPDFRQKTPDNEKKAESSSKNSASNTSAPKPDRPAESIPPVPSIPSDMPSTRQPVSESKSTSVPVEPKLKPTATKIQETGPPLTKTSSRTEASRLPRKEESHAPNAHLASPTKSVPAAGFDTTTKTVPKRSPGNEKATTTHTGALPQTQGDIKKSPASDTEMHKSPMVVPDKHATLPSSNKPSAPAPLTGKASSQETPLPGHNRVPGAFPTEDESSSRTPTQANPKPLPVRSQTETKLPTAASTAPAPEPMLARSQTSASVTMPKPSTSRSPESALPTASQAQVQPGPAIPRPASTGPVPQGAPPQSHQPPMASPVHRQRSSTIQAAPAHRMSQYASYMPPIPQQMVVHHRPEYHTPGSSPPSSHPTSPVLQPLPSHSYGYHPSPPPAYVPMAMSSNVMSNGVPEHLSLSQTQQPPNAATYAMSRHQYGPEQPPASPYFPHQQLALSRQVPPHVGYGEPYYPPPALVHAPPMAPAPPPPASDAGTENSHGGDSIVPRPGSNEDPTDLLQRVTAVLPDLNRLLQTYKTTQGDMTSREAVSRQQSAEHEQALMHKDFYIKALEGQMRKAADERAEESTAMKGQIQGMALQIVALKTEAADWQTKHNEVVAAHDALSEAQSSTSSKIEEFKASQEQSVSMLEELKKSNAAANLEVERLKRENSDLRQLLIHEKDDKDVEIQRLRGALEENLAAQKAELKKQSEQEKADMQKAFDNHHAAREDAFNKEKVSLRSAHNDEKSKLEVIRLAAEADSLGRINTLKRELDETRRDYQDELDEMHDRAADELNQARRKHNDEISAIKRACEQELKAADQGTEKRIATLVTEHTKKEAAWRKERESLEDQLAQKLAQGKRHVEERDELHKARVAKEQQLKQAKEEFFRMYSNMEKDRARLDRIIHSLGEANELKSRGDQFYLDAFGRLRQSIVDLSISHFRHLPVDPPRDVLVKVPSRLPPFWDNTAASRSIRSLYIQHFISDVLLHRIFQPFLFTLSRRFDKADTLFQMLSAKINQKSVRREAVWRQQTLMAAYTASDAKQSINIAGALIVDELFDGVKHFADPTQHDHIHAAIRHIVKIAAETWRHARVEKEMIVASMPPADVKADGYWVSVSDADTFTPPTDELDRTKTLPSSRPILLRLFPHIVRHAVPETFLQEHEMEKAKSCTYSAGVALTEDSPMVATRWKEHRFGASNSKSVVSSPATTDTPTPPQSPVLHAKRVAHFPTPTSTRFSPSRGRDVHTPPPDTVH